jgi:hypothetical protein
VSYRVELVRARGLSRGTIHISGLSATAVDVPVRLERLDGTTQVTRLTPSAPSFVVAAAADAVGVARTYKVQGIEHIRSGVDHLRQRSDVLGHSTHNRFLTINQGEAMNNYARIAAAAMLLSGLATAQGFNTASGR